MKRIGIYLERRPESGGAYQYCLAMLNALSGLERKTYQVIAFCTYPEWNHITQPLGLQTEIVQKSPVQKVVHYAAEHLLKVETYRKYCRKLHPLARKQHELGIDACIYPCGDKISFMLDIPAIISVFDLMHRYLKEFPEIVEPAVYRSRERSYTNIAKYAKLILVDSQVGRQQMIECYDTTGKLGERIRVLPFIAPDYVYKSIGKEKYPRPDVFEKYIFYPAQFWLHKNHKNLIKAIGKLKKEGLTINAVFCGSGKNAFKEVQKLIIEYGLEEQIMILGYVSNDEMVALYQHARALVMPTFGGPTNIPQLEAFALGCPVATSNIFGIPDQVGDAALLFQPDDVGEIAQCIRRLWTDDELCLQLKEKGYEKSKCWGEAQFMEKLRQTLEGIDDGY